MKTMKTYYIPETEVMDLKGECMMTDLTTSFGSDTTEDRMDAPARHLGGSLGPSY